MAAFTPQMVNVPKERRTFCKAKKCTKHTVHKVTQYKSGKASNFAQVIDTGGSLEGLDKMPPYLSLHQKASTPGLRLIFSRVNRSLSMTRMLYFPLCNGACTHDDTAFDQRSNKCHRSKTVFETCRLLSCQCISVVLSCRLCNTKH